MIVGTAELPDVAQTSPDPTPAREMFAAETPGATLSIHGPAPPDKLSAEMRSTSVSPPAPLATSSAPASSHGAVRQGNVSDSTSRPTDPDEHGSFVPFDEMLKNKGCPSKGQDGIGPIGVDAKISSSKRTKLRRATPRLWNVDRETTSEKSANLKMSPPDAQRSLSQPP